MMDRLTDGRKTVSMCISSDECFRYNRLAAYEDNGQTPEEQAEMIADVKRIGAEKARLCEMIIAERAAHKELDEAIASDNARLRAELEATKEAKQSGRIIELPDFPQDIHDILEPLKVQSALNSEMMKLNFRKEHAPKDVSILDYTIIAALYKVLDEHMRGPCAENGGAE